MPEEFVAYYQLKPDIGVDGSGNLEPIADIGVSIAAPQMSGGDMLPTAVQIVNIKPTDSLSADVFARVIPGTRMIETTDVRVATAIHALGLFDRVDPPTKKAIDEAKRETRAHVDAVEKAAVQVAAGNEPAPDATDPVVASEAVGAGDAR